jgi:periplasmic protein TonB
MSEASLVNTPRTLITPADRFGITLCFAIILHTVVILGVNFSPTERDQRHFQSMEIILVQQRSEQPEKPSYLAQANLTGGGDTEDPIRPAAPLATPLLDLSPAIAATSPSIKESPALPREPAEQQPEETPPDDERAKQAAASLDPSQSPKTIAVRSPEPSQPTPLLPTEPKAAQPPGQTSSTPEAELAANASIPTAAALISHSFAMASLNAEIDQKLESRAKHPRRKYISANTREYKYASYMDAWRIKVERIGNLNYPDEAQRKKLGGDLILDVALNFDGSVNEITLRRPSGYKILDDAAIRIVNLAAPFAPFPADLRKDVDILHITRTWQFLNGDRFLSKAGG